MAITYTAARALLASQATTLAAQATIVGLTSLATALTNLSTEITSATISEDEFFGNGSTSFSGTGGTGGASPTGGSSSGSGTSKGSAAQVYAQILNSAAHTINCANFNIVFDNGSTPLGTILSEIAQASENTARASEDTARASETIASKLTAIETYQKKLKIAIFLLQQIILSFQLNSVREQKFTKSIKITYTTQEGDLVFT